MRDAQICRAGRGEGENYMHKLYIGKENRRGDVVLHIDNDTMRVRCVCHICGGEFGAWTHTFSQHNGCHACYAEIKKARDAAAGKRRREAVRAGVIQCVYSDRRKAFNALSDKERFTDKELEEFLDEKNIFERIKKRRWESECITMQPRA